MNTGEYLTGWVEKSACTEKERASRRSRLARHILPTIGQVPLEQLSPLHVEQLLESLRGRLSSTTARKVYNDLRSALGRARRLELIGRNPAEAVDRPRAAPYRPTIWTDEELGRFLATCRVYARESLPFVFAYVSGARQGEVLGLQWRHVDLASGTVYFVQDLERPRGGGFAFGSVKTGNSARAVKLPSAVTEMLREQRERRPSPPHDLVFANRTGNPLHGHNLTTRTLKRLCREAQVPPIRFHDLRHLHNTVLMRRGVNPKIVAARAGHATTAFTLDRYSWATADLQDAAAEALGRTMGR